MNIPNCAEKDDPDGVAWDEIQKAELCSVEIQL